MIKTLIAAAATFSMATTAQAASCWKSDQVAAARIAEFNAAMMVTTLRCGLINVDIKGSYDSFIVNYKKRLNAADDKLKDYFDDQGGDSKKNYHQFYTLIGNRYGAAATDSARCGLFAAVANELAKSGSDEEVLDKYAQALVPTPAIPGERCAEVASKP